VASNRYLFFEQTVDFGRTIFCNKQMRNE